MELKVCCIQDEQELALALRASPTFVGLVGAMPSGPGPIPDDRISALSALVPSNVTPVLLTARTTISAIVDHVRATGVRAVQIVREVPAGVRAGVRDELPDLTILQVVHVTGPASVEEAERAAESSDYLLLDSGRPTAPVAELGGTGRTHDWEISARIVSRAPVPVLLAGGLRPGNVADAITAVSPRGVDACSGLRTAGRLDIDKLERFIREVRGS